MARSRLQAGMNGDGGAVPLLGTGFLGWDSCLRVVLRGFPLLHSKRAALLATACLLPMLAGTVLVTDAMAQPGPQAGAQPGVQTGVQAGVQPRPRGARALRGVRAAPVAPEGTIGAITVTGNQRIESGTIKSYMLVQPGDPFDPDRIDRSLKTLFATGLFQDVSINRDGNTLTVKVVENPIVNRIAFEGNRKLNDDQLKAELQLRARAVFTPQLANADRQRLLDLYARRGRFAATVEPKVIRLDQNRVDVVFEVNEGETTLTSRIAFVGNHAYSESRLREVINSREQAIYRLLSTSDQYDPEKVNFDKELLRRFYLKNGYADFEVKDAVAELSPDRRAFFVTFTLTEGKRYKIGAIKIDNKIAKLPTAELQSLVPIVPGDTYDGDAVERASTAIQDAVQSRGFAFVEVKPQIARNKDKRTVDLVFTVSEGPRVYIERIDIVGNTRTKDKVIRREVRLAEGDAFNLATMRRSKQRLQDLGYFNSVVMQPSQGSAADKAVITTTVDEKATGELTLGGGYSTDAGALVNAGLHERNLVGTGVDAGLSGVLAQRRTQVDLSITDPYFLDRNLVAGFDLFRTQNTNTDIAAYNERRLGGALRLGYEFNEHLRQAVTYSLVDRNVYQPQSGASIYILDQLGHSLLSQVGQTLTLDYRDSRTESHEGFILRLGTDVAGLGGTAKYVRTKLDGSYYYPLEQFFGDPEWLLALSAGGGYLAPYGGGREKIIDRFFLGGDNLRGFQSAGAGPHGEGAQGGQDSIGGRVIYTQTTELRFPLPISPDLGLSGRTFVDVGGLSSVTALAGSKVTGNTLSPRVGAGIGVSWQTPFGLINLDLAEPVLKQRNDKSQFFRFGFGTRF